MEDQDRQMVIEKIHSIIQELVKTGHATGADGVQRRVFPVALNPCEAVALRDWVLREKASQTIEIGLAFGFSTLHVCEGLVLNGNPDARNVSIDPNQLTGYASVGLRVLQDAGVAHLVEYHDKESQLLLPQFLKEGRCFDFAFIDGNHRFDYVFVDLFFLRRLVRRGGVVVLDDYNLPGVRRAVSFFVTNIGWNIEDTVNDRLVVLRTATTPDERDFSYFVEF